MNCRIVGPFCQLFSQLFSQAQSVEVSFNEKKLIILRKMKDSYIN